MLNFVKGLKARVCNVAQKHILLYWVKWSCCPESRWYIMYLEKGKRNENNQTSVAAAGLRKSWSICAFPRIARIGQMPSCLLLPAPPSVPTSSAHAHVTYQWCRKYSAHSSAEIQSCRRRRSFSYNGRENAASVTCNSSPLKRQGKESLRQKTKKVLDKERSQTRANIGCDVWVVETTGACEGPEKWCRGCCLSVGQVILCFVSRGFVIFIKYVRSANLAMFVARISSMLTLAFLCVVFSHENG